MLKMLYGVVAESNMERFIDLKNNGESVIVFRTRVSVQNIFILKGGEGVLQGHQSCRVVIYMKDSNMYESIEDIPVIKFAVELLEYDNRYDELGPTEFWKRYSAESIRKPVLTNFQISSIKQTRKRSSSPKRLSWADESSNTAEKDMQDPFSPGAEKHKKHIAEMEIILNGLKRQLAKESSPNDNNIELSTYNGSTALKSDVNIEEILKIGNALLKKSVGIINENSSDPTEATAIITEEKPTESSEVEIDLKHEVADIHQVASPKPFSKPRGRLFELMIKNVSRDQLLTSEEAEVRKTSIC